MSSWSSLIWRLLILYLSSAALFCTSSFSFSWYSSPTHTQTLTHTHTHTRTHTHIVFSEEAPDKSWASWTRPCVEAASVSHQSLSPGWVGHETHTPPPPPPRHTTT